MSKVVRVLQVFSELDSGGVPNFVMNIYRALDRNQIQFDFAMTGGNKGIYDDEVLSLGGKIFYFDISKDIITNLRAILNNHGPYDVVHSHVFFYSGLILNEAKKAKVPIRIAHAHNAHTGEPRNPIRLAYEKSMQFLIRMNATHMLGCSEKACRYVFGDSAMKDRRTEVVPDGIDSERFAFNPVIREEVRTEFGLDGKFVVGHVGHFTLAKNHEKILSVFNEIRRLKDNSVLLLVGDGELEQEVRQQVETLGLTDKVIFAGAHQFVERFYQAMDVFLFPSKYEGFGMAMIEAQASGLMCVASDVVPKETNIAGMAEFYPLNMSDSEWAERIVDLFSISRNREEYCASVKDVYGINTTVARILKAYDPEG